MNDKIEHKHWWKRNWKWATPVFGFLVFILVSIAVSPIGTKITANASVYADPNLLENAVLKAQENEEVTSLLGTLAPIGGMDIMQGIVNYSNNNNAIDVYVRIHGSKGKGRMRVFADRENDQWNYNNISVIGENRSIPIVVLNTEDQIHLDE